jgi:voltage-gated potassium channel
MANVKDEDVDSDAPPAGRANRLRSTLRHLYHGRSRTALNFQFAVLVVDLAIIAFFIIAPVWKERPSFLWLDYTVAAILLADIVVRGLSARDVGRWLRQLTTIIDLLILATLLAPTLLANLGFLRILRLWTLSRSGFLWRPLRRRGFSRYEEIAQAVVNVVTFLFVVSGFIYTFFAGQNEGIEGYLDALYFTVSTVTTTGFGDVTLEGSWGRIVSIVTMFAGITLFVRLAQALFRPTKVNFPCPQCGLIRHDPDAVHCKACGHLLNIPDEGIR